jgi:hypothetical protein
MVSNSLKGDMELYRRLPTSYSNSRTEQKPGEVAATTPTDRPLTFQHRALSRWRLRQEANQYHRSHGMEIVLCEYFDMPRSFWPNFQSRLWPIWCFAARNEPRGLGSLVQSFATAVVDHRLLSLRVLADGMIQRPENLSTRSKGDECARFPLLR